MNDKHSNNEETQEWFRKSHQRGPSPYAREFPDEENDIDNNYNLFEEEPGYNDWDTSSRPTRSQRMNQEIDSDPNEYKSEDLPSNTHAEEELELRSEVPMRGQRSKYHARMDRFLNNGILLVGVLLVLVLVIAFLL